MPLIPRGGPMPPGLAAIIGGGPAAPPPGAPPLPPPAAGPQGPLDRGDRPGEAEDPRFDALIRTAINALHQAQATGEDDQDKQLAAECMAKLQGLLGTHQKQGEAALGMTDVHRGVRRAIRGAGAGGPIPGGAGGPGY